MIDEKPTAFLCRNASCQLPTTHPHVLAKQLQNARTTTPRRPRHPRALCQLITGSSRQTK